MAETTAGDNDARTQHKKEAVRVRFGRKEFTLSDDEVTGGELRRFFGIPTTDDLFRAEGNKAIEPAIKDEQVLDVKDGDQFTSAPKRVEFGAA